MKLSIIAVDLSKQDDFAEVVDQFHENGLISDCLIVDISKDGLWSAAWPNELQQDLSSVIGRKMWSKITVVSVRGRLGEEGHARRVRAEEALLGELRSLYSGSDVVGATLSEVGASVADQDFPQDYEAHFLHENCVYVDPRLPRVQITDTNRGSTLIFVALTIAGCARWDHDDVLSRSRTVDLGQGRTVRFIRVLARVGQCPPIVGDTVRVAVRPGGGAIPADAGEVEPMENNVEAIRLLADGFVKRYKLKAQPSDKDEVIPEPVHWLTAVKEFLRHLPKYMRGAAVEEWKTQVDVWTGPLKEKLDRIIFGEGSRFVIDGVEHEKSPESMSVLAGELKTRLAGFAGIASPIPAPEVWEGLMQVSFGLLDAGEFPDGVEVPRTAKRILFMDPRVVGPDLENEFFELSPSDQAVLEYPPGAPTRVGLFEDYEVGQMKSAVSKAAGLVAFKTALIEKERSEEARRAKEKEEEASRSRLRGTFSRDERIATKSSPESGHEGAIHPPPRLPSEIVSSLRAWDEMRRTISGDSLVANLYRVLNSSVDTEFERLRWDEVLRLADEVLAPPESRSTWRKVSKFFLILLVPLLIAAFLVSSVFGLVLTVIGVPLVLFVGIGWLTSFGFALVTSVFKRALEMYRWDNKGRIKATKWKNDYDRLIHSINEFRRLELLRMQFADWQRFVRELSHNPYGKMKDAERAPISFNAECTPPQFVVASFRPDGRGLINFRHLVHQDLRRRGYLSSIKTEMMKEWRTDYELKVPSVPAEPLHDVSGPNVEPGVSYERRHYLMPRRDFVNASLGDYIKLQMVRTRVERLDDRFRDLLVSAILGGVEAGDARPAYREVTPHQFLFAIPDADFRSFGAECFNPEHGGEFFVDNIDRNVSYRTRPGLMIRDFILDSDENGSLLGSTRIDVSVKVQPFQLAGFREGVDRSDSGDSINNHIPRI